MRFSQRIGKTKIKKTLEREEISEDLLNSMWTLLLELVIDSKKSKEEYGQKYSEQSVFFRAVWIQFFKRPIDNLSISYGHVDYYYATNEIRAWFYETDWYN